jgi:hypothetical protein
MSLLFIHRHSKTFDQVDDTTVHRRTTDKFHSLLEQNVSIGAINTNRVLSRPFKRHLVNDRLIKIPSKVDRQRTYSICIDFLLLFEVHRSICYFNDTSFQ